MSDPLGFVVCGAPLASRSAEVARALVARGWELAIGVTDAGAEWVDSERLSEAAEREVSVRRRLPTEERRSARPSRVVAFPLTFNTANKIAAGIMDNHVTGTLCDALGTGAPIVAALMVSNRLWGHPAWKMTLDRLVGAGVRFVDLSTGAIQSPAPLQSGTGGQVVDAFDPEWMVAAVESLPASSE